MIKIKLTCALLLLNSSIAHADWTDTLGNVWKNTKEISGDALESSKEYSSTLLDKSKDYYDEVTTDTISPSKLTPQLISEEKKEHIRAVWSDVLGDLDTALKLNTEIDAAPDSKFFGDDKKSLGEDQMDVFKTIEALLSSPAISKNRDVIDALKQRIREKKNDIAGYMEKRIVADNNDRADYDQKIEKLKGDINELHRRINDEKDKLQKRFHASGLLLSNDQVDVLLSRVDADDIIKMSLVYDVLADITQQLMGLTKESNENINQARKYYGMHVVLLKLVINMQDNYVKKLDEVYLPKIDLIRQETLRIKQESTQLLANESKNDRKNILRKNVKAQQLTIKVAKLYTEQLNHQKAKVKKARGLVMADYKVAKNTYDTVKISADLIRLMRTNRASFNALMNIQIPDIIPFENIAMQKKFEEMSSLIK
ncbi:MAG TPA: hypothetical protein EYG68_03590 [Leucothrix mucor]|nr:hypothetical protein [Leucothrix mucor]